MSEIAETYSALRSLRQEEAAVSRVAAAREFRTAQSLASETGLELIAYPDSTYALEHSVKRWRVMLYPGNRRIFRDKNRPRAPYLKVTEWSLTAVVLAASAAEKTGGAKS